MCLHKRKSCHDLFHRTNARELAKPQVLPAPLQTYEENSMKGNERKLERVLPEEIEKKKF